MMAQRRRCAAKFNTRVVLDLLTGRGSMAQLRRGQDLKEQIVTRWRAVLYDFAMNPVHEWPQPRRCSS
jgi:hypothetical protein